MKARWMEDGGAGRRAAGSLGGGAWAGEPGRGMLLALGGGRWALGGSPPPSAHTPVPESQCHVRHSTTHHHPPPTTVDAYASSRSSPQHPSTSALPSTVARL